MIVRLRPLLLVIAIALVLYGSSVVLVDAQAISHSLSLLDTSVIFGLLSLSLVNYGLRFWRWHIYIQRLGGQVPLIRHCLYYITGFALTISPGKAGEILRAFYLQRHNVSYAASLAAFFAERLLDVLAIALLATLLIFAITDYHAWLFFALLLIILTLYSITRPTLGHILHTISAHSSGRLQYLLNSIAKLVQSSTSLLRPDILLLGLAIGLIAWLAEGIGLYWLLYNLQTPISLSAAIGVYSLAVLAGALAFLPGGLGGTEAVMGTLLVALGVPLSTALGATLICRVATLWFAVLLGGLAWLTVHLTERP